MTQGGFYEQKTRSPTALAVIVLLHGVALTAVAMSKMEVVRKAFEPTTIVDIVDPPVPPPEPPPPVDRRVEPPQHRTVVDRVPQIIPLPLPRPTMDAMPLPTPPLPYTPPGNIDVPPTPPPPPPPPPPPARKVEPARARANLASYVSDADYPVSAQRNEEQGTTRFRLSVGADGRVSDCTVTGSSGSSALDAATCKIMRSRARFTPARDSNGNPTGDTVASAIRWVLPDG